MYSALPSIRRLRGAACCRRSWARPGKEVEMNCRHVTPLLTPALLILAATASAQPGSLTGSVHDEGGAPLFAANVLVTSLADPSLRVGHLTNRSGAFRIDGLRPGRYEVRVSYVGYETSVADAVTVSAGRPAQVTFTLVTEPIEMNKIVVSASRKEEKAIDAPAAVQVVRSDEIRERATLTPADHVLGRAAIDVQRAGVNQGTVVIRGFNNIFSGAALTMVDHRIARVPSLRYNALNLIPTTNEDIEQMEVVSGPGLGAVRAEHRERCAAHPDARSRSVPREGTSVSLWRCGDQDPCLMVSGRLRGKFVTKSSDGRSPVQYYQGDRLRERGSGGGAGARRAALIGSAPDTRVGLRDFDVNR